jgi:hypothetical protein
MSKRVLTTRTTQGVRELLTRFGVRRLSLHCDVFPRALASTSSWVNCDGYGYIGRYAAAITARSGANRSPTISGTYVYLSIVRVLR